MVFNFPLPTTSHLSFQSYFSSPTHPALPQHASTARHTLCKQLKQYKRLMPSQRPSHLSHILSALNGYIPYLLALSRGLSGADDSNNEETIVVVSHTELETSWRPTLSSGSSISIPRFRRGKGARVQGSGIEFEIAFVLSTLGYVLSCLARIRCLTTLYAITTPTAEQKATAIGGATKDLLLTSSVHNYLASSENFARLKAAATIDTGSSTEPAALTTASVPDIDPSTQSALSSLALAEATLLAVLKDDAYLSSCIQSRNQFDNEWMVKPPDIPKVRTMLFARLCVRGAEYADQAVASAGAVKVSGKLEVDEEMMGYMRALGRVARAKACRFMAIDAEMAGNAGEGIAWLRAGKAELGAKGSSAGLGGDIEAHAESMGKSKRGIGGGFSKLRKEWSERREERKVEKEAGSSKPGVGETTLEWGDDSGREEETRVIEMLETKWTKMNDTVNTQAIPSSGSYASSLPSGRDIHSAPGPYKPPQLEREQLFQVRAPPENDAQIEDVSSSDDEIDQAPSAYY